jgi:hypothetical protein
LTERFPRKSTMWTFISPYADSTWKFSPLLWSWCIQKNGFPMRGAAGCCRGILVGVSGVWNLYRSVGVGGVLIVTGRWRIVGVLGVRGRSDG